MSRSDPDRPDDEELADLLVELSETLEALRGELADERDDRRRGLPRPPSVGELLRFTNDYTIPTVIATLQATIEALELFRRFLELAAGTDRDRGRVSSTTGSRFAPPLSGARDRAAADVSDALSRLRTALAEADLPEDEASRSVVEDARALTAEIEDRIAASRDVVARERERERRGRSERSPVSERRPRRRERRSRGRREGERADEGPVTIDVEEGGGEADESEDADKRKDAHEREHADEGATGDPTDDEPPPEVDVDAELRSIRAEVRGREEAPGNGEDEGDADDGAGSGRDPDEALDDATDDVGDSADETDE